MPLIVFVDNNQIEVQKAELCAIDKNKTVTLYSTNGILLHKVGEFYNCSGVVSKEAMIGVQDALS